MNGRRPRPTPTSGPSTGTARDGPSRGPERRPRRAFLHLLGAGGIAATAGCSTLPSLGGRPSLPRDRQPPDRDAGTQFRGGLDRLGVDPDASVPDRPVIEWTRHGVNTGDHTAAKASPVAAPGGDIVVPGDTGELRRVTPAGEVVWRAAVERTNRGIHGTPAIANDTVYIGAYDGALYAFDLETGDRFWRRKLGDAIGSSPGYHDGTVYIAVEYAGPNGSMFAVDAVTGETTWVDRRPTDHPHSTCAIDLDAGRLVVGANDGNVYAWSYPGLEFVWSFPTGEPVKGPIATADGSAFFGSWDRTVYRVDLADGEEQWAVELGNLVMTGPSVEPETDTVYAGSHDTNLYALDTRDGSERWRFDTGGALIGCPAVAGDHVLVGSYDQHCYAVEKTAGELAWRVPGVGRVTSTPLVAGGAVYFTDRASEGYLEEGTGPTGSLYKVGSADGG